MKRFTIFIITLVTLLLVSCSDMAGYTNEEYISLNMGFKISLPNGGTERSATYYNSSDAQYYEVSVVNDLLNFNESVNAEPGTTVSISIDEPGCYNININAYNENNRVIAYGETESEISMGETKTIKVMLSPMKKDSFLMDVEWETPLDEFVPVSDSLANAFFIDNVMPEDYIFNCNETLQKWSSLEAEITPEESNGYAEQWGCMCHYMNGRYFEIPNNTYNIVDANGTVWKSLPLNDNFNDILINNKGEMYYFFNSNEEPLDVRVYRAISIPEGTDYNKYTESDIIKINEDYYVKTDCYKNFLNGIVVNMDYTYIVKDNNSDNYVIIEF